MGNALGGRLAVDEFLEGDKGVGGLPGIEVGEAQLHEKPVLIVRAETHRRLVLPDRLLRPPGVVQDHRPERRVGGMIGIEGDRPVGGRDGLVVLPSDQMEATQERVDVGQGDVERQRPLRQVARPLQ